MEHRGCKMEGRWGGDGGREERVLALFLALL